MAKSATTIDQQLDLLKSRGLTVNDADKAREILLDITALAFTCSRLKNLIPNFATGHMSMSRVLRSRMWSISTTSILTFVYCSCDISTASR